MTATLTHRGLELIEPDILRAQTRRGSLIVRSDEITAQLADLREQHGRAIAEDSNVDPKIPGIIRELSEEQEATARAITLLEEELVSLADEKKRAEIGRAEVIMRQKSNVARELSQDLHKKLDEFANQEIIPLANRLLFAVKEGRAAEYEYDRLTDVHREPWQSDLEKQVVRPSQKALAVTRVLRAYAEDKPLPIAFDRSERS